VTGGGDKETGAGRSTHQFVETVMRAHCLFLLVLIILVGCQGGKADPTQKAAVDSPNAADAPSVHGKIMLPGEWTEESLAAGFVGKGRGGKNFSNSCELTFSSLGGGESMTSETFKPQLTSIFNHATNGLGFNHVKLAPGDYVVYVHRGKVPAAWKKVTVKEGDQLTVDLTIDPAKMGSVVVTLPDDEANAKMSLINSGLFLIPIEFAGSERWVRAAFEAGYVEEGNKTVARKGVPAGKYLALRGKSEAEVEVAAGKESAVTLVRKEAKK
jgi:hypothetical protein